VAAVVAVGGVVVVVCRARSENGSTNEFGKWRPEEDRIPRHGTERTHEEGTSVAKPPNAR